MLRKPTLALQPTYDSINMLVDFNLQYFELNANIREFYIVLSDANGTVDNATRCVLLSEDSMAASKYMYLEVATSSDTMKMNNLYPGTANVNGDTRYTTDSDGDVDVLTPAGYVPFPTQSSIDVVGVEMSEALATGYLGCYFFNTNIRRTNMKVREIVASNAVLTTQERTDLENYLMTKWGV